jgi:hypothetical protein
MAKPIRHVRGLMRRSTPVAALLAELERREQLLQRLHRDLPPSLAAHCRQAALDAGRLTLIVDSPVWVSRLKVLVPQLVDSVREDGIEIVDWRIRALPLASLPMTQSRALGPPSVPSSGPSAERPLAAALRRLSASLSARSGRQRR